MRRLNAGGLLLAGLLFVSACGATLPGGPPVVARLRLACDAYATSLEVMAPMVVAGRMSAGSIALVDDVILFAGPVCSAEFGTPPGPILDELEARVLGLLMLQREVNDG